MKKNKRINYGKQYIDNNDINIVKKSLTSSLITSGNYVEKFEREIVKLTKTKYALSCVNGTAALHLAFIAANIKKNDIILMPVINFISAYRMLRLIGAKIYLVDVYEDTGQISIESLIDTIKKNKIKNVKAILTMYLGGYPENIVELYKIKKKFNTLLIEDACHAFGGKYEFNKHIHYIGSCKHADISIFSFHPVKTITTGEGGMLLTNTKSIHKNATLMRSHGIIRKKNEYWNYDIEDLGFNYRLSDINCALGLSQLRKLNKFINYRKKIFNYYLSKFAKLQKLKPFIKFPKYSKSTFSSFHLFIILIDFNKLKLNKNEFFIYLNNENIFPQFHYKPINDFSFYKKHNKFSGAEAYKSRAVSLPIYYGLKNKDIDKVIFFVSKFIWNNRII